MQASDLIQDVITLTKKTGAFIKDQTINEDVVETKSKNSLVTYVDKTAEKMLVDGLSKLLPEAGFIAEEGTSTKIGEIYNWIIDPLDGTTNFIHGLPCFSISIALQRNDETILGIVYEINHDELFYATENGPAYLNDKIISVSETNHLEDSLIATGFPYYDYEFLDAYMKLLAEFMKDTRGIRRMGSAAVDLAYVACGRFDAYFEYSLNAWDVAAGAFIVQQAGGKVSDFKKQNNYLFGRQIIASNSNIYNEFFSKISNFL